MKQAVLFDIDGTILNTHSAGKASLLLATEEVFGTIGEMKRVDFQGKTDPLILHESLLSMGFSKEEISQKTPQLKDRYFHHLNTKIWEHKTILHPGITEIVNRLQNDNNIILGLLTGNFSESAKIKLSRFDLNRYFSFGVFGDDAEIRNEMPAIAQKKIQELHGIKVPFHSIFIIGDTVHDIRCAKHSGAVSIAVGTGWTEKEILLREKPDYYFEDLSDTDSIHNIFQAN